MKKTTRKILKQGIFFTSVSIAGNILNLIFNFFLGRYLTPVDFALVALFMGILYAVNVFFNALALTASHCIGISSVSNRKAVISRIYSQWGRNIFMFGLLLCFVWTLALPFLSRLWKVDMISLTFLLPIFIFGMFAFLNRGILQGKLRFSSAGLIFFTESGTKLFVAFAFVAAGMAGWAYLAIPISVFIAYVISKWFLKNISSEKGQLLTNHSSVKRIFSRRFFVFSFLLGLSTLTFLSMDVILAKTFFSSEVAGGYSLITLSGKILFLFSSILGAMIIPVVSNAVGERKNTKNIFRVFFGISFLIVFFGLIFFLLFGKALFVFFFGQKIQEVLFILPLYITSIATFSLVNAIVLYHHAKRKFIFSIISSASAILLIVGAILFHASIGQFVNVLFLVAIINLLIISILHLCSGHISPQSINGENEKLESSVISGKLLQNDQIPTVTVGLPAYNEQHNIKNILQQILQQKQKGFIIKKIIVASDGSTDNTAEVARKFTQDDVIVIDGEKNRGQNYRQNEIISNTSSDVLVLLNADIVLNSDDVILHLVSPILEGADLSAQWAKPLTPKTFLEKILCAGFELKYYVYTHYKNGDNIYTCVGHMRALSRKLYLNVIFPQKSGGEDQYLYLFAIADGYKYRHAIKAEASFRLPSFFGDYKRYAKRIFQTQKKHGNIFGDKLARAERSFPANVLLSGCIYSFMKYPLCILLYIGLHVIMQQWAKRQPLISKPAFEVSTSTKQLQ